MTPFQTWKQNKHRSDLRLYTREFQKRFNVNTVKITEVCDIYAANYRVGNESETDKHHVTPLIMSFGRFKDDDGFPHVRGLNLLYLSTSEAIELMEVAYTLATLKPDSRVPGMIKLHEECMKKFPHAFKNLEERRLLIANKIDVEEWGMIPLLQRHLFGNFNTTALKKDFITEHRHAPIKLRVKKPKKVEEFKDVETVSAEWSEGEIEPGLDDNDI